jgi:hypothetical protein
MAARGVGVRELARPVPCHTIRGHISNLRSGKAYPSPDLAKILDGILGAARTLAALAAASGPVMPDGNLGLIELARRAEVSNLGAGTLKLLAASTERLCRGCPGPGSSTAQRQPPLRGGSLGVDAVSRLIPPIHYEVTRIL